MSNFDYNLRNSKVVAVVCNQFGDTGKGKFTDYLASEWADIIARGTGGNNAGHTVVDDDGTVRKYHGIPSGVKYDPQGKINILGNGMVIDPIATNKELKGHLASGGTLEHLMISKDAFVITPYHIAQDLKQNHALSGIGSTGKGIGPAYADKTYRMGLKIVDLLDKDKLAKRLKLGLFFRDNPFVVNGGILTFESIVDDLYCSGKELKPYIRDTIKVIQQAHIDGKHILIEGAQGLLLSNEFGVYPYVTSSDPSIMGSASGIGLTSKAVDFTLGIVKFPFMSKVGGGPFPTEIGGREAEEYSWDTKVVNLEEELKRANVPYSGSQKQKNIQYDRRHHNIVEMINSKDPLVQNRGICLAGEEFGVTTGRKRRIGWTDLVALRYAVQINGPYLVLTKPDAISGIGEFSLCNGYTDIDGNMHEEFSRNPDYLRVSVPRFKSFKGYGDIRGARDFFDLPGSLREAVDDLEKFTGGQVVVVSNGPERGQTIIR